MVEILNLRKPALAQDGSSLVDSIIHGLQQSQRIVPGDTNEDEAFAYAKEIPTSEITVRNKLMYEKAKCPGCSQSKVVLYDDKGLDIYNEITECEEYYLYGSELDILTKYGQAIAKRLFSSTPNSDHEVPCLGNSDTSSSDDSSPESEPNENEEQDDYTELHAKSDSKREKWGDANVGRNNYGVNGNLGLDDHVAQSSGTIIELGAGSLKKTSVLLRSLHALLQDKTMDSLNYYALDLEHGQLVSTLTRLAQTESEAVTILDKSEHGPGNAKIIAKGICASYDDALPHLKEGKLDQGVHAIPNERKCILFLGSSIGNYSREEAIAFLKKISTEAMTPGDSLLIGIDSCDDKKTIEIAYNDSRGVTQDFVLNGIDHVDRIFGGVGLTSKDFKYVSRYNQRAGRHEAYVSPARDISFDHSKRSVQLTKDELIRIERSYKYTVPEALALFAAAGLRVVERWVDDERTNCYYMYLVEKPLFKFSSTLEMIEKGANHFGLPTLEDWDTIWKSWDCVTLSMITKDMLHTKPIDLRHICLFYLGHIPGFLDIHMSRYLKEPYTEPQHYPDMFERGIDPNMDDPSKVHAHSIVPTAMEDWPSVDDIVAYRDRVRARLRNMYATRLNSPGNFDRRLARVMGMVYEHEALHLETLLYMAAQVAPGKLNAAPCFNKPDWQTLSKVWQQQILAENRFTQNLTKSYDDCTISIGHDDFDHLDVETLYDPAHAFGWDNESPRRETRVQAFKISLLPISNGEYLNFFKAEGSPKVLMPGSWVQLERSNLMGVRVLTAPGAVPMDVAKDWPCMASGKQLEAYAKSVGGRLPTEPELRRYNEDNPVDHVGANIGFSNWHPVPAMLQVTLRDGTKTGASNGGVWEWSASTFETWENWRASELYPDYSRDFFDGCHWIMLGGSFATIPRIAGRKTFTNWYQATYPYVFAGARVAYDI